MTTMDEPDVLCADVVRIYRSTGVEVQALQGLDLRVDRGEVVAVVGASGSGKSTLLNILAGLDTPTAGTARVAGHDLLSMGRRETLELRRHGVGFVWQQTVQNLVPYLTCAENVALALSIGGTVPRRRRTERARELLAMLGVHDRADHLPERVSGGEQQRVAIAVGVANEPRVLLADEPTGELDDHASVAVLEAFEHVNAEQGTTVLVVTHDDSVSGHVQRTVQIRDGRTSTETLRRTHVDQHGQTHAIAQEYAVLDKVGRLQLPHDFTERLGLRDRVELTLEPDHVGVWPHHDEPHPSAPEPGGSETGREKESR